MPDFQRAPANGPGLPGTACAPDLFTRIDRLTGLPINDRQGPIRAFLGFNLQIPPSWDPPIEWTLPGSFVRSVFMAFSPGQDDPWYIAFVKKLVRLLMVLFWWLVGWLGDTHLAFQNAPRGCNNAKWQAAAADKVGKELVAKWVGFDPSMYTRISAYALNYICPTITISAGDAIQQYLVDSMTAEQMHDYAQLNGLCTLAADVIVDNQQYRTSMGDATVLWRRGMYSW